MKRFPALASWRFWASWGLACSRTRGFVRRENTAGSSSSTAGMACTLYSGTYVMYVSEKVRRGLRPYAGQAIRIDAKEVFQPMNPGDGRIGSSSTLDPLPTANTKLGQGERPPPVEQRASGS